MIEVTKSQENERCTWKVDSAPQLEVIEFTFTNSPISYHKVKHLRNKFYCTKKDRTISGILITILFSVYMLNLQLKS